MVSVRSDPSAASARRELEELVARGYRSPRWNTPPDFPRGERPAAVLVLFGVLDWIAADSGARALAVSSDLDVLLLERSAALRNHAGQVAFPGGRVEPGEDAVTAALREAEEETGLDRSGVEVLGTLGRVPVPVSNHLVTLVLGWWARPSRVGVVDVAESSHVFRAPVADLVDPDNRFTTVLRRNGLTMRGPGFHVHDGDTTHLVWGFTGGILDTLFTQLGWAAPWDHTREHPLP